MAREARIGQTGFQLARELGFDGLQAFRFTAANAVELRRLADARTRLVTVIDRVRPPCFGVTRCVGRFLGTDLAPAGGGPRGKTRRGRSTPRRLLPASGLGRLQLVMC
jgi:hypothetical protein